MCMKQNLQKCATLYFTYSTSYKKGIGNCDPNSNLISCNHTLQETTIDTKSGIILLQSLWTAKQDQTPVSNTQQEQTRTFDSI